MTDSILNIEFVCSLLGIEVYLIDLSTVNLLTVYTGRLINKIGYFSNRVTNSVLLAIHDMLVNKT